MSWNFMDPSSRDNIDRVWRQEVFEGSGVVELPRPETRLELDRIYEGTGVI